MGHVPHHFNTRENQNHIGDIPSVEQFGVIKTSNDTYKDFETWYETVKDKQYDFQQEMIKYCRAYVELLSKSVLKFRQMFKHGLDVDPFRYVTLPSLTMSIYRYKFIPNETIVANEQNKKVLFLCKEWLIHLNDKNLLTE